MAECDTYLTDAELRELTGRTYRKPQCMVLAKRGIPFVLDGDDRPKVLRAVHDELLGLKKPNALRRGLRLDGLSRK